MRAGSIRSFFWPGLLMVALQGCSAGESLARPGTTGRSSGMGGSDNGGGTGNTGSTGGTGWGGSGGSTLDATTGTDALGLACRAKAITDARCASTCHTSPPKFGAPMALASWQDFQQPSQDPSRKIYQAAADRIHRTGRGRMPESETLSGVELGTLDTWFSAGAPAGASCGSAPQPPDSGGPRYDATLPDAPTDDATECVEFRAHGAQTPGDRSAFDTSMIFLPGVEFYACFNFASPWKQPVQALQFSTIIDNSETLHHWLLYQSPLGTQDGSYSYCDGQHPGQALITGWAPGNDGLHLPPDVGLELPPPTGSYVLELHYNNPSLKPFLDRSGVRVCATTKFRPKTASITWAGTEKINILPRATGTASGKCDPGRKGLGANDDIHVFNAWPHMHKSGTRMATIINRKGGGQEIMLDKPFNFASQIGYDIAVDIHPGDSLFTTCYYDNTTAGPIGFGPSTTQEMCYDFLYAYPAHALDHPPFGAIVTSAAANLCTDN
ncbi:MAG TPA: hypothetical protein VK540_16440 [Polyangiaceae bacterium]|nr:hypothetical protein [Polyangiaceae bacterium]